LLLASADANERRFGHHCCRRASAISIKHRGQYKLIDFYFNLLNLFNCFDGVLGKIMRKAAHPSGGVGSSNPSHLRGWRLHHHGDGVW
jgi:hypothetical protein